MSELSVFLFDIPTFKFALLVNAQITVTVINVQQWPESDI